MNILFISNDPQIFSPVSAARERMRAYADEVARRGGTLHILSRAPATQEFVDGPHVLHGFSIGKLRALKELPRIAREIILKEDIMVVSAQDPFEHGSAAAKAVEGTKAKLHIQIHTDFLSPWFTKTGAFTSILNRARVRMAGDVLPKAQGIRVVSERIKKSLLKGYRGIPEPSVIPIAVPAAPEPSEAGLPGKFPFKLLAVGRLESEKRVQDLISAMYWMPRSVELVIVGDGRQKRALEALAEHEGLASRVFFLGSIADARSHMAKVDAFVQASAYEGYGLTLIEAALAGTPIVTTKVGIVGDVLQESDVYTVPIADPQAIAAQVQKLVHNRAEAESRAASAKAHVEEHLARTDSSPKAVIHDIAQLV